ncbi:hypothetical protein BDB00DRAFT_830012 [Zychaea mexicana]|uniref:uncharacterized protein n=1 Tax=Zychaea mexicana TaxID=64656 RepID=UPI0022FDC342|nr:uncharacterized protein BDB00DRAFT_830012 [Zychaea mexicana]KAI9492055.1 hypothetical protein BDB00DRAFT_830012 [Zychaea mexicana]
MDERQQDSQVLGKRAQKLNALNNRMVNTVVESLSQEFKQCFEPIADGHEQELESSHDQIVMYCSSHLWKQFDMIATDTQLIDKLNKMEEDIRQQKENPSAKAQPRVVPEPDQVIRSLRVKLKMEALAKLREDEAKLRVENERLMSEIAAKTETLEKKRTDVNTTLKQYHEIMGVARSIPVEELEAVVDQIS